MTIAHHLSDIMVGAVGGRMWRSSMVAAVYVVALTSMLLPRIAYGQGNPAFIGDPINNNAGKILYFDSNSDCNRPIYELFGFEATIRGSDISSTRLGPTSCTIRLKSESQFGGTLLYIEVRAMNIKDCTTLVSIYDGDGAQLLLMSYDCNTPQHMNRKTFLTSGSTATFIMTRQNVENVQFDIEIRVTPSRAGNVPGYENNYGSFNLFAFDKFSQDAIVGMIGGFYCLILIICIVLIIYFHRQFRGLNKEWETHQLATLKTGAGFDAKSQMSQQTNAWSVEMSRVQGPNSQYSRGFTQPIPRKTVPPSEDGESEASYLSEGTFQKRQLVKEERNGARPRYTNTSYSDPEDNPDHFEERIITPRVKTGNAKNRRPPSYEEAISDHTSEYSSEDETASAASSRSSVRNRPPSSDEDRSSRSTRSRTPSESESEEQSDSDDGSRRGRGARTARQKPKPSRRRRRDLEDEEEDEDEEEEEVRPQPKRQPQQQAPPPMMQPMPPFGAYPPGQFMPMMAGPAPFQPVQVVPGFPPPRYPQEQPPAAAAAPRVPQVQPTDPPVYSYLVRRGYNPVDEHNTSASTAASQSSGGGRLEEPDIRLDSGVEYMRR